MPSAEQGGTPEPPEDPAAAEAERPPYLQAARFGDEPVSRRVYNRAQEALYATPESGVSVYRLQLNRVWHVAALGELPPAELADQLDAIFAAGEPAELPGEVITFLMQRRAQATRIGPWVERHERLWPPEGP
jgi:hypothetical protein